MESIIEILKTNEFIIAMAILMVILIFTVIIMIVKFSTLDIKIL